MGKTIDGSDPPNELGDDADANREMKSNDPEDLFPIRLSSPETPVTAEVKWWEKHESKEDSAAERLRLDGKEDLRNTPVIISDSTVMIREMRER